MPAPYTIEQTAEASGLSIKFIRRLKAALPEYFEKHTERGQSNALLFDEEMLEVLKRTRDLKNRGRTLQQIRDELAHIALHHQGGDALIVERTEEGMHEEPSPVSLPHPMTEVVRESLNRENELLRSQVTLLQDLIRRAEERFDRLLPAASVEETGLRQGSPLRLSGFEGQVGGQVRQSLKSQLLLWLVEAAVVTVFAAGFIFMIWLFAQRAFSL